jgi:hypothetical protein
MLHQVALVKTEVSEECIATIIQHHSMLQLLVTADVAPSSPTVVTLMMEAILSSETSFLTGATLRIIAEDSILHSHCRENFKSCMELTG